MPTVQLVTGGAGFIGSHLVARLVREGARVRVLDDLSTGSEASLAGLGSEVDLVRGDVRDPVALGRCAQGASRVFHLAALVSVERSMADPALAEEVNAVGTLRALDAARAGGAERFVFASSAAVYGDSEEIPKIETMPRAPVSPYAIAKAAGEQYVGFYARHRGLPGVSLRFFNVFGPGQDPTSPYAAAIPRFVSDLLRGARPTVFGDGLQSRDFCPVEDVVDACVRAGEAPAVGAGEVLNVGRGERLDVLTLISVIARLLGRDADPFFAPPRPGDVRHSQADVSLARRLLGFSPCRSLDGPLERTVRWYAGRGGLR